MITQFVVLALAAVVIAVLVYVGIRRPVLFLGLLVLWLSSGTTALFFGVQFGSYSFYSMDLVVLMTWGIGFARFRPSRMSTTAALAAVLLAGATALGVLSWSLALGVEGSVVFWRGVMLAVGFFVYPLTAGVEWGWDNIRKVVVRPALIMLVPMVVALARGGLWGSVGMESRPLGSEVAMLWLIAMFLVILRPGPWTALRLVEVVALASGIVLLQHRSVWVAAAVGGLVLVLFSNSIPGVVRAATAVWGIPLVAVVVSTIPQLQESSLDLGTWDWRVEQLTYSFQIPRSVTDWLVGSVLGPTPVTQPGVIEGSAHMFVASASSIFGLVGLAGFLLLFVAVARRRIGTLPIGLVVVAAVVGYSAGYGPDAPTMGLFAMLLTYDATTGRPFKPRQSASADADSPVETASRSRPQQPIART